MSSFQENKDLAVAVLSNNAQQSLYVSGAPGNGKTSLIYAVAEELSIPKKNVVIFRPSLRDPVDLMGVPSVVDSCTHWNAPEWLCKMRTGRWMLGVDELPQGTIMMQNALSGLMLDRMLGDLVLSPEVLIMATGNRTVDKAGANRVVGQLANRIMLLEMESSLDGWCEWALNQKTIPSWYISFLRFRPNLLNDYMPDRFSNPTERTHAMVATLPESLSSSQLFLAAKGLVGEGCAAEMVAFKKIADAMPDIDEILMSPDKGKVPTDPATLYAVSGALAFRATKDNFGKIATYLKRLPPEFLVMGWRDSVQICKEVASTRAFVELSVKYSSVLSG